MRRLHHLVALADERHFARAAERVHLSQPAFSRSIQALESEAGHLLFDRSVGNDLRPTPAGEFVIERARRLLFEARSLQRDLELYGDGQLGDTAFGAGPFPAATLLPQVLPELRRAHPQVSLRVEVNNWTLLLERLHAEDIEFFVADVIALAEDAAIDVLPLGRQHAGFYVRAQHPLAEQGCTPRQMWQHGIASVRLPPGVGKALAKALGLPAGQPPAFALQCDDVSLLRSVALSTDTVLGISHAAVRADVDAGLLRQLNVTGLPELFSEMAVVSLHGRSLSPMARRSVDLIVAVAREVNAFPGANQLGAEPRKRRPAKR